MLDTPQITQTADQHTAVIHLTIPRDEIVKVMGPGITEVMAAVAAQGVGPAGPWFSHHLRMDPAIFDFEIRVPVMAPIAASGRVKAGRLPAATVARTVYHGPYEGLGAAWASSVPGSRRTGTRRAPTCGNAISSVPRRPPTLPAGARSSTGRCAHDRCRHRAINAINCIWPS